MSEDFSWGRLLSREGSASFVECFDWYSPLRDCNTRYFPTGKAATINMSHNVVVGVVPEDLDMCHVFQPGTRVAALYDKPLHRFASVVKAIEIPRDYDAGEVAATLSTYIPIQCMLNIGRKKRKELRLLVNDEENSSISKQIFHLAKLKGFAKLYFRSYQDTGARESRYLGVERDDGKPMDVIIDISGNQSMGERLSPKGRLVICSFRDSPSLKLFKWKLALMLGGALVDHGSIYLARDDVSFLLSLLQTRRLRPQIASYTAHTEKITHHGGTGVVICEPWKD